MERILNDPQLRIQEEALRTPQLGFHPRGLYLSQALCQDGLSPLHPTGWKYPQLTTSSWESRFSWFVTPTLSVPTILICP